MATYFLAGDAVGVAGVYTTLINAYDATTTYKLTINGKVVSVLGQGGTSTTTAAAFVTALNASTIPEFAELTWANNASATVTGTDDGVADPKSGRTQTIAASVSGGAGTIGATTTATTPDGSNALTANNVKVSTGARGVLPGASDIFYIQDLAVDLKYSLDALSAVTLATLNIEASMEGDIALPFMNEDGSIDYNEYRARYLKVGATTTSIGRGNGGGSARCMVDFSNVQTTCSVFKTGTADGTADGDLYPCILKGTHASNALRVYGSSRVETAPFPGESAVFTTVHIGDEADVKLGLNSTLTTVNVSGKATLHLYAATTTLNVFDQATVYIYRNAHGTINIYGSGKVYYWSNQTITALNLYDDATFDCDESPTAFTITTMDVFGEPTFNDRGGLVTWTNAIDPNGKNLLVDVTWNIRGNRTLTFGAP